MSRSSSDARRRDRGFTLVECMVGVLVLSLMAVGFMKLSASHERIVGDLEIARGDATSGKVQRPKDPYQRVLGARAKRTTGVPRSIDAYGVPETYFVDVTSVEHRPSESRTTAVVQLDCYAGELDATAGEALVSVWETGGPATDFTLATGSYAAGVLTSDTESVYQTVDLTTTGQVIDAGTYHVVSDATFLATAELEVDTGSGVTTVGAASIGTTEEGLRAFAFVVPSSGVVQRLRFRQVFVLGAFTVSLIEECVVDDLL